MSDPQPKKSFFTSLWERRFFQFFATYIAASWGAIQFLEWGVKRYDLPSVWVDKLVILLLALLPLVCSLIYFHGKIGDDKWWKFEKVFYPINIILALMMSVFLVNSSANDITQEVKITDVEGEEIVREIPKQEFNKRVVVFPVEGDRKTSWEGVGISELLNNKLEQDMRIIVSSAMSIDDSYEHYGYEKFQDIPFSAKMKIAIDNYSDYFVESKFVDDTNTKVEVKVFETVSGKEKSQAIVEGIDIYNLTEKISDEINGNIKLTEVEGKELYVDFPASNMISADSSALRSYIQGAITISKEANNIPKIFQHINKSVELDPTCAECWSKLSYLKLISGQDQAGEMDNAFKYIESLPERQQLSIKYFNYLVKEDVEKAIKLCDMWRKLYPLDSKPVSNLITLYSGYLRSAEAKQVAKEAIESGHKGSIYLTYANMLIKSKDWEEAEIYLKKYKETYPKQFEATSLLVDTYAGKGHMDKALEALDELIIMNPNEESYMLKKAGLYSKLNKFDEGLDILHDGMNTTELPSDVIANLMGQISIYQRAMKFEEFGKTRRKLKSVFTKNYPPIAYLQTEYSTISYYAFLDQVDSIDYHIKKITSMVAPSRQPLVRDMNEFMIKLFSNDTIGLKSSYLKVKPMFESSGSSFITFLYDAEINFAYGNYDEAINSFEQLRKELDDSSMLSANYFESFLRLDRNEEGLTMIEEILRDDPLNPMHLYFKAKYLSNLEKKSEAKETMGKVIQVFKDGDPRARQVKEALALASELGM